MSTPNTQSLDFKSLEQSKFTKTNYTEPESIKILEQLSIQKLKESYPDVLYHSQAKYSDKTLNELTRCVIDYIRFNAGQAEIVNQRAFLKNNRKKPIYVLGAIAIDSNKWFPKIDKTEVNYIHSVVGGKFVRIEVKQETADVYNSLKGHFACQKEIDSSGGSYLRIRNFTDFYNWLNQ